MGRLATYLYQIQSLGNGAINSETRRVRKRTQNERERERESVFLVLGFENSRSTVSSIYALDSR